MNLKEASDYLAAQLSERIIEPKKISKIVASTLDVLIKDSDIKQVKKQTYFLLEKNERQKGELLELDAINKFLKDKLREVLTKEQMNEVYKSLDEFKKLRYEPKKPIK